MKEKSEQKVLNPHLVKLGKRIKELRLQKGISAENFAYENKLSRSLYGSYERGTQNITYLNLLKITEALGISLQDFFNESFEEKPQKESKKQPGGKK